MVRTGLQPPDISLQLRFIQSLREYQTRRHKACEWSTESLPSSPEPKPPSMGVETERPRQSETSRTLEHHAPVRSLNKDNEDTSLPPKRGRARPLSVECATSHPCLHKFLHELAHKSGQLWSPEDAMPPRRRHHDTPHTSSSTTSRSLESFPLPPGYERLTKQPETRPIIENQLFAEVKGIYAGLVMVESKCIEVDKIQNSNGNRDLSPKLNDEQWQALTALHRTLLHEHHDFFLASQHPSARPALRRMASKYAMPARMWRHGIHSFLELSRHRIPASLEHMLTFVYLAYSMMALLYETTPTFEDTWVDCLGDLGRYRIAIEDDDLEDRKVWTSVSRQWYSKASDKELTMGRLYHHLAVLARPSALQQLFYYTKAQRVPHPCLSGRESAMTQPGIHLGYDSRLEEVEASYVKSNCGIPRCAYCPVSKRRFIDAPEAHFDRINCSRIESGREVSLDHNINVSKRNEASKNHLGGRGAGRVWSDGHHVDGHNLFSLSNVILVFLHSLPVLGPRCKLSMYHAVVDELGSRTEGTYVPATPRDSRQDFTCIGVDHSLLIGQGRPGSSPEDFSPRGVMSRENYLPDKESTLLTKSNNNDAPSGHSGVRARHLDSSSSTSDDSYPERNNDAKKSEDASDGVYCKPDGLSLQKPTQRSVRDVRHTMWSIGNRNNFPATGLQYPTPMSTVGTTACVETKDTHYWIRERSYPAAARLTTRRSTSMDPTLHVSHVPSGRFGMTQLSGSMIADRWRLGDYL